MRPTPDPSCGSDRGVVRVGGVDLREVDPDARRAAIRMVPQDGFLFDVSIRDNIAYGREGTTANEVERAIDVLGLRGWIETLPDGLDTVVGERGGRLSVGERQLVALARARSPIRAVGARRGDVGGRPRDRGGVGRRPRSPRRRSHDDLDRSPALHGRTG